MSQGGSLIKRGATWTAYWFVADAAASGGRRQRTKGGFRTKDQARIHLTEQLGKLQAGTWTEPSKLTVGQYLEHEWLPQRHDLKASTRHGYAGIITGRLVPAIGGIRLRDLTAGQIGALYAELRESGNRRGKNPTGGISERSLKHTHTVLHKALEDAVDAGLISRNPARAKTLAPKPRNVEMRVWSADEVRVFLASTEGDRFHACYLLALARGLRRGELLGLKWGDVDLDQGQLSIRRARVSAGYEVVEGEPKSGRARVVPLTEVHKRELRAHRRRQLEERMAWGEAWADTGYVFTSEDGNPVHPQTLAWHFTKAVRAAGVPVIRFHDLRHTCATIALTQGVPAKVVQEMLGHSSISITLDLYTHVVPGMQDDAAAKIDAIVFGN